MKIKEIKAIQIMDSRGNPTVRTFITLENSTIYSSSVPSGASTGKYEAVELRDNSPIRYSGKGITKAVENVNSVINQAATGMDIDDPISIDEKMLALDGTENKSRLGANAILSVSQAVLKAAAGTQRLPLWKFINQYFFPNVKVSFPRLMVNIVNGGKHAGWNFDIQEFMIVPKLTLPSESIEIASGIFRYLGDNLNRSGYSTLVGDEGGYSPALASNEVVLKTIIESAQNEDCDQEHYDLSLDCAASEWVKDGSYMSHKSNIVQTADQLTSYYLKLQEQYKILSFEDPFSEDDWDSFQKFTKIAQEKGFIVVGDDLYTTNPKRIQEGIEAKATNAVLVKPNQIGTISETVEAIKMAKNAGLKTVVSHRSGETEDSFIADLAYGSGADFLKAGSMSRSERLAKYNRLLEIEQGL